MRKWTAILLCLALLAGLCGCAADEAAQTMQMQVITEETQAEANTEAETATEAETEPPTEAICSRDVISGAAELVPEYTRVDIDAVLADCNRMAASADSDEVLALYDALYEQFLTVTTMNTVAGLCNSMDVTDGCWAEELAWSTSAYNVIADAVATAYHCALEGSCGEALREHMGDDVAEWFAEYVETDEYIMELSVRESELCSEYYALDNEMQAMLVSVDGEEWSYEMLCGEEGDELYYNDYDRYALIERAVLEQMNEQLGALYVELVTLRQEMAAQEGCDNYIDYGYELYGRTYNSEQVQVFCDAVKNIAKDTSYFSDIYYTDIGLDYDFDPLEPEELIALLGDYAAEIDPLVSEGWEYMTENELYMLPTTDVCNTGGYTTNLPSSDTPYIYDYISGDAFFDFEGLSHEFGHFLNAWLAKSPNEMIYAGDYDVAEIHSTGLEMLYAAYYDEIFGDGARTATCGLLLDKLDNVVTGCIYDEFQRRVYATEDITLDDVNRIYGEVCVEYGRYDEPGEDYSWMFVHHNFDQPLYYISYAASALVALQIWELSQSDYDAAVQLWRDIVHEGGYTKSYMEVVAENGLSDFTDEQAVATICTRVIDYLKENG